MFNRFRAEIRNYNEIADVTFDTFARDEFIEKRTASIYIPRRFKCFGPQLTIESLMSDYPGLHSEFVILHRHVFEEDIPGRPKREGDCILIIGGPHFLEKLSFYPEEFVFHINRQWKFTVRGGPRKPHTVTQQELDRAANDLKYSRELSKQIAPVALAQVFTP